jgi:peptidoglycan hydrolase-like protein with peptidoglycan-binding domain
VSLPLRSPRFTTPPTSARFQQAANNTPTIKKGESNTQAVRLIQQALIDLGIPLPISTKKYDSPDGDFGNETHEAVKFFQRKYLPGETPDGKVGKNTLSKFDDLLPLAGAPLPPLADLEDPDEAAKDAVIRVLAGAFVSRLNFVYCGQHVNDGWFARVRRNIDAGKIGVRYDPIVADYGLAVYVPENNAAAAKNHIVMPNYKIITWKQRSVLVHECVHASQDLRGIPLTPALSEGAAHVAQNLYHRYATGNRVTDSNPLADKVHREADRFALRVMSGETSFDATETADLDAAIAAVPMYQRPRVGYDGVPDARE